MYINSTFPKICYLKINYFVENSIYDSEQVQNFDCFLDPQMEGYENVIYFDF